MAFLGSAAPTARGGQACRPALIAAVPGAAVTVAVLIVVAIAALTACTSSSSAPGPVSGTDYYVSLGDSLSQGYQPDQAGTSVRTSQGYPDQLYTELRRGDRRLRLVKLGCGGETTSTMLNGRICHYPEGSQLAAAASFLRAHTGRVRLITIGIGSNDLSGYVADCQTSASFSVFLGCLKATAGTGLENLAKIVTTLRTADGGLVRIIGMTNYDPMLAQWLDGPNGQAQARDSEDVVSAYGQMLAGAYKKHGARVADVFGAFRSTDFSGAVTLPGIGAVPPNVAAICQWTWECAGPPRGPNVHANTAGYLVIARAILRADS